MMRRKISEMKYLILISSLLLLMILSGCATTNSVNMDHCKKACRGQVQHYQDDEVECSCKEK